jgi:hypothetical protein
MVLTVLEAVVAADRGHDLRLAFEKAIKGQLPPGLVRTNLLCAANDPTVWRIETLWASLAALDAMRGKGTPEGVLMFRAAGAEPALTVFDVVAGIDMGASSGL